MSDVQMSTNNPVLDNDVYESEEDYVSMAELDEENINWGKLCCRIISIFLLLGIICLVRRKSFIYTIAEF
jgi:hypothetical protein